MSAYDRLKPVIDTQFETPDECLECNGYPCEHVPAPLIYVSTPYHAYSHVTMELAARLDQAGLFGVADLARKYAVDRPRWWHRLLAASRPAADTATKDDS